MTPSHLQLLQHALGLEEYGRGAMYRNYFAAGGADEPLCRDLVSGGLMREHRTTEVFPYYNCSVTDAGKAYVQENSPAPPKQVAGDRLEDYL